jgi:hypothetical protein
MTDMGDLLWVMGHSKGEKAQKSVLFGKNTNFDTFRLGSQW